MDKYRPKNQFKIRFGEGLGLYLGGVWESCGKDLEALGASWAVLRGLFFKLVFGVVFKSALGGLWTGFWVDFKGSGTDSGRVLARFGEEISKVLAVSGLLWATLGYWDVLGWSWQAEASKSKHNRAKASKGKQQQAKARKSRHDQVWHWFWT